MCACVCWIAALFRLTQPDTALLPLPDIPHPPLPRLPGAGDILVFLTGRAEIERACDELFKQSEEIDYEAEVPPHKSERECVCVCV